MKKNYQGSPNNYCINCDWWNNNMSEEPCVECLNGLNHPNFTPRLDRNWYKTTYDRKEYELPE